VVVATGVVLAGIAQLTLFGTQGLGAAQRVELDPIAGAWGWSGIAWRPVIDNVTLFVPLGAALAALWSRRPWIWPMGAAVLVSLGVEVFQWAYPSGRIANSADVIANSCGALVGIVLARLAGVDGRGVRVGGSGGSRPRRGERRGAVSHQRGSRMSKRIPDRSRRRR
jgi:hypothetical protein